MGFSFSGRFSDSFRSLLTGLGVPGRDKVLSMYPTVDQITYNQKDLENLYRGNWIAKKIVELPAFDCTRAWRSWNADQDQIEALEEAEREFGIQQKVLNALIKSRLYGGSAILLGVKGSPFNEELDLDTIRKGDLKFVHVVEKWMMQAGPRVRDITSPWFGEPTHYMRSNTPIIPAPGDVTPLETAALGYDPGDTIYIHPSRVVRLVGCEYPDIERAPDVWGDSVLTNIYEAIRDASLVTQSLANMIADSKVDVFKIPGLTATLSTQDGTNKLISYLANANVAKSTINSLVIDKEIDWERIQTKFEGLPEVLQAYLLICAAGADIPSTRMLSREPSGMNATGDSDTRNYYDRLSSEQKVRLTPLLNRLDEVLIRHTLGKRPDQLTYDWNPLWQMSETERAEVALKKAQAFKIDVDSALIPAEVLVRGRENQIIEDGFYPGFDAVLDEMAEDWEDDVEFLSHMQLGQQGEMAEQQQGHEAGLQKQQLSAQKEQFKQKGQGKENDFGDDGQAALGFMVSQASHVERRKRSKRPFAAGAGKYDGIRRVFRYEGGHWVFDSEFADYDPGQERDEHGRWTLGAAEKLSDDKRSAVIARMHPAIKILHAKSGHDEGTIYVGKRGQWHSMIAGECDVMGGDTDDYHRGLGDFNYTYERGFVDPHTKTYYVAREMGIDAAELLPVRNEREQMMREMRPEDAKKHSEDADYDFGDVGWTEEAREASIAARHGRAKPEEAHQPRHAKAEEHHSPRVRREILQKGARRFREQRAEQHSTGKAKGEQGEKVALKSGSSAVMGDKPSNKEQAALARYTQVSDFMNKAAWEGHIPKNLQREVSNLDSLLDRSVFTKDMVVYRGCPMSQENFVGKQGKTITLRGFTSTSGSKKTATEFKEIHGRKTTESLVMKIALPKGSKGLDLKYALFEPSEGGREEDALAAALGGFIVKDEKLLPRDAKFKIGAVEHGIVNLEYVK